MRLVIQRVTQAKVEVNGQEVGAIGRGLLVLIGVAQNDTDRDAQQMADKCVELRIFEDEAGKMNRSLLDCQGELLAVSQFTLLADCSKGRRPSFIGAAPPDEAERLYEAYVRAVQQRGVRTATGRFRANMQVSLTNDGPVTILLES